MSVDLRGLHAVPVSTGEAYPSLFNANARAWCPMETRIRTHELGDVWPARGGRVCQNYRIPMQLRNLSSARLAELRALPASSRSQRRASGEIRLTPRESEILRPLREGKSAREIAAECRRI